MSSSAGAALALALALAGCGSGSHSVNNDCPPGDSTGGDPVGTWTVSSSCQVTYAQTASPDWCSSLVYFASQGTGGATVTTPGTVKDGLFLGQAFVPVATDGRSTVAYMSDPSCPMHDCGAYSAMLVFEGPTTTDFPLACLRAHTPNPTCTDLRQQIHDLAVNTIPTVDVDNMEHPLTCIDDGHDGCSCSYLVSTATIAPDVGTWRIADGLLTHYPSLPNLQPPELAQFAVGGGTMSLHGYEGVPLLAHDPLRSLSLTRSP